MITSSNTEVELKDIAVIIVNYNGGDKLLRCLHSLDAIKDERFSMEVIVVDNHSTDGRLSFLIQQFPRFQFIVNSGNNGFANGCNFGAAQANAMNLLFLNPDTSISSDALFNMLEEVRVRPEYSIISCRQVRDDGKYDRPYGSFLTLKTLTGWQRAIYRIFAGSMEESVDQTTHYIYPDWVSGSVILMRTSSFFRLGKWDDDYWMYFEDVDLCRRARAREGEIVKMKEAVVRHSHGGSSRQNSKVTVLTKTEVHISRHLYIAKHEPAWRAFFMHLILILNNMVLGLIPLCLGTIFFFIKGLNIDSQIYLKLAGHYLEVLKTGKWMSRNSVNYYLEEKSIQPEPISSRY